jgi:hypothetical protein
MPDSTETFTADYPCDWHCTIEFALPDTHIQYTRGQMRRAVDACHVAVHAGAPTRAEFTVTNKQTASAR